MELRRIFLHHIEMDDVMRHWGDESIIYFQHDGYKHRTCFMNVDDGVEADIGRRRGKGKEPQRKVGYTV